VRDQYTKQTLVSLHRSDRNGFRQLSDLFGIEDKELTSENSSSNSCIYHSSLIESTDRGFSIQNL